MSKRAQFLSPGETQRAPAERKAHLALLSPQLQHLCLHIELHPVVFKHLYKQVGTVAVGETMAWG